MEKNRLSLIDGSIEQTKPGRAPEGTKLVPVYGERPVEVQTLEGVERIVQKVLLGYVEEKI